MDTQVINNAVSAYIMANPMIILLIVWAMVWKLIALWKAAKNNHLVMFIILGILNTAGIAEIIYIVYLYFKGKKMMNMPEQKM